MITQSSKFNCIRNALLVLSIVATTPIAHSADDAAQAAATHRAVPTASVSSDQESLAAIQEALAPRLEALGCEALPTAPSSPRRAMRRHGAHHGGKHEGESASHVKHRGAARETAFYGCGGEETTQKLLGAAQEAVGSVLEKHPDALIQIAKVFVRPSAFLSATCPTQCPTISGPKPGFKSGGFCFVCAAK